MTLHAHVLAGCAPAPLAQYLKALGVFRLVATQVDPTARAFWRDDCFVLVTVLERAELNAFFLRQYEPAPLVAPWNGGSGFYGKHNSGALEVIAAGAATRFTHYRAAIALAREVVGSRSERPEDKDKKLEMLAMLRQRADEALLDWLNVVVVLGAEQAEYPALLGSGGNDGNLDFTNNQMQRLVELIDPDSGEPSQRATAWLDHALWGQPIPGLSADKAIGQFMPGSVGGPNASAGFEGDSLINPWDYVLTLEGTLCLQVAASRRLEGDGLPQASAPFAIRSTAAGYASAASSDEGNQRGEQWLPIWLQAVTYSEIRAVFDEARLRVGKEPATNAIEAAAALARLGSARGIVGFERYAFIERNGKSNLAVPLGRWSVATNPNPRTQALDEIVDWLDRYRRAARAKGAPKLAEACLHRIEEAMLGAFREPGDSARWQALLISLGQAEDLLTRRRKWADEQRLKPLPRLSAIWREAADDHDDLRPEFRIAAAIAAQAHPRVGLIRDNCVVGASGARAVVWAGRSLEQDLIAIVLRRIVDGQRQAANDFPLRGDLFARLADIDRFLRGAVDDARIAALARPLMAVRLPDVSNDPPARWNEPLFGLYALFRVAHSPSSGRGRDDSVTFDPAITRLLLAGRCDEAVTLASRRLRIGGARPKISRGFASPDLCRRIVASLAIPLSDATHRLLKQLITKPEDPSRPLAVNP